MTADLYEVEPPAEMDDPTAVLTLATGPLLDADRPVDFDDDGYDRGSE